MKRRNYKNVLLFWNFRKVILQHNLDLPESFFGRNLRDEGFTIGRLDSRYKGIDKKQSGIIQIIIQN